MIPVLILFVTGCSPSEIKTYDSVEQLLEYASANVNYISVVDLEKLIADKSSFYLIDCREPEEFDSACVIGAVNVARGTLEENIAIKAPDHRKKLIIYCKTGKRATLAAVTLKQFKYSSVFVLEGGFKEWQKNKPELVEINPVRGGDKAKAKKPAGGCGG